MQLVRRTFVLLLAYLGSVLASSLAVVTLAGLDQGVVWADQLTIILPVVVVLGVGVAWLPLGAAMALLLWLLRSPLVASLCAGVLTAFVLLVGQGRLVDGFLSVAVSPVEPPLWRQVLQDLPSVVVVGLVGGIVFWALAYRGKRVDQP